jgi:periplasmic copper chaperone A
MTRSLLLAAAIAFGTAATAHEYRAGPLEISHPFIPATASATAGGYFTIVNTGTEADSLVGIEAGFAKSAMLHASSVDASGVARMTHLDALPIGPGETVTLEPGGLHVMFMGLSAPLTEGAMLPATLTFEHAGTVAVEFKVEAKGAAHAHASGSATD